MSPTLLQINLHRQEPYKVQNQWSNIAIIEQSPLYERSFHQYESKYIMILSSALLWNKNAFILCGLGTYRHWFQPLAFDFGSLHRAVIVLKRVKPVSLWRDSIDIIARCGWRFVQSFCSELPETLFGIHMAACVGCAVVEILTGNRIKVDERVQSSLLTSRCYCL